MQVKPKTNNQNLKRDKKGGMSIYGICLALKTFKYLRILFQRSKNKTHIGVMIAKRMSTMKSQILGM